MCVQSQQIRLRTQQCSATSLQDSPLCQLPYLDLVAHRVSMKIGEHYDSPRVTLADWRKHARVGGVPEQHVVTTLSNMTRELPDHISVACDQAIAEGLDKAVVVPLMSQLIGHVKRGRR